jgi:hypothetical protein
MGAIRLRRSRKKSPPPCDQAVAQLIHPDRRGDAQVLEVA